MRCPVCGSENPANNQFCSSCGKPLPKLQYNATSTIAGPRQAPAPAVPKGSGLVPLLLIGGLLFFVAVIGIGIFVILPMFDEEPSASGYQGSSYGYPDISDDLTDADSNEDSADSQGSLVPGSGNYFVTPTATTVATTRTLQAARTNSAATRDPIIGTWEIGSTGMQMQFSADGSATLSSSTSGDHSTGSWENIATGRYHLRSASGVVSPVMVYDPLAGMMHSEDYSTIFIRRS